MNNTINSGSLQGLQVGQTLLLQARKVNGGKIQLEFAEIVKTQSNAANPLALFNKSDDRFSQGNGARRAWLTAEAKDASVYLNINLMDDADWEVDQMGREILPLNVINPVAHINGEAFPMKVEVFETVTPTEWQANNIETAAKRRGKDGAYCTHKGLHIFSNAFIAFNKANHVFLEMDAVEKTTSTKSISAVTSVNDSPFN